MNSSLLGVASGDAHPLIDIDWTVGLQFALFVLLFLVARAWLFKPYMAMREARALGIDGARAEAVRMTAEAEGKLVEYQTKLAAARSRALDEQRKIRGEAIAHERDVTDKARATAASALEEATARVRAQVETARKELLPRADAMGLQMVERLLGRKVA